MLHQASCRFKKQHAGCLSTAHPSLNAPDAVAGWTTRIGGHKQPALHKHERQLTARNGPTNRSYQQTPANRSTDGSHSHPSSCSDQSTSGLACCKSPSKPPKQGPSYPLATAYLLSTYFAQSKHSCRSKRTQHRSVAHHNEGPSKDQEQILCKTYRYGWQAQPTQALKHTVKTLCR